MERFFLFAALHIAFANALAPEINNIFATTALQPQTV